MDPENNNNSNNDSTQEDFTIREELRDTVQEADEISEVTQAQDIYETNIYDVDEELNPSTSSTSAKRRSHDGISWKFIVFILLILLPIRLFVAEPFLVYGSSMEPNFDTGDYLIVDEISYKLSDPKRGDVVVLQPPTDGTKHFIKRIIGLPNETIDVKGDRVTIYNSENPNGFILSEPYLRFQSDKESRYTLKSTEYFVMGDNRAVSYDSRSWGPLSREHITGKAFLRLYPFNSISILPGDGSKFK
jgi:signal peptidase I